MGFAALMGIIGLTTPELALPIVVITAIGLAAVALLASVAVLFARIRPAPRSAFAPALYERPPQRLPQHIARVVPDRR